MWVRLVVLGLSLNVRGLWVALALGVAGCVTTKDAVGGGDSRLDEAGRPDAPENLKQKAACGADGKGGGRCVARHSTRSSACVPVMNTLPALAHRLSCSS